MLSARRDPEPSRARTLVVRAVVLTATVALSTVVAWLIGAGSPAHATERSTAASGHSDAAQLDPGQLDPGQLLGTPRGGPPDHAEGRDAPDPLASAVGGSAQDKAPQHQTQHQTQRATAQHATAHHATARHAERHATEMSRSGTSQSWNEALQNGMPQDEAPGRATSEHAAANAKSENPPEDGPSAGEVVERPVTRALDETQPVRKPVVRVAAEVTGGAVSETSDEALREHAVPSTAHQVLDRHVPREQAFGERTLDEQAPRAQSPLDDLPSPNDLPSLSELPAVSDLPVVRDLPAVRDIAGFLRPLWTDQAGAAPSSSPPSPAPAEAVGPTQAPAHVTSVATPARHDASAPRTQARAAPGTTGSAAHALVKTLDVRVVSLAETAKDKRVGPDVAAAVISGAAQGALPHGWYPTPTPSENSAPSAPVPRHDNVRTGTSAPQPGTTPD